MSMYTDTAGAPSPANTAGDSGPRFISCCEEELVELALEALRQGGEQELGDGANVLTEMADIAEAAQRACDRALAEEYTALDEGRFRAVFTLAWCAGYRAQARRSQAPSGALPALPSA